MKALVLALALITVACNTVTGPIAHSKPMLVDSISVTVQQGRTGPMYLWRDTIPNDNVYHSDAQTLITSVGLVIVDTGAICHVITFKTQAPAWVCVQQYNGVIANNYYYHIVSDTLIKE